MPENGTIQKGLSGAVPWAILIGGGFLILKVLEGFAPRVGEAAGKAVGGATGGIIEGALGGIGNAIGYGPNTEPIQAVENLPVDAGGARKTARIISPVNGSLVERGWLGGNYPVTAEIQWNTVKACVVAFEAQEFPRAIFSNAVSRKQSTVKLQPGRNLVTLTMPITASVVGGLDIVLSLSVDGEQYDSVAVYTQVWG